MGKLVRRFIKTKQLEAGTWSTPLSIYAASQIACQFVHNVFTPGTSEGGFFGTQGSITSGNLNLIGVHGKTTVLTAKNIGTGYMYGVYIEQEVLGTATIAGLFEGIRLEQYVESTTTFASATVYSIHIANSISKQPSSYSFFRLSEDGACYVDSIFLITKGASCTDMKYLFEFVYGAAIGMIATVGACSGTAGYLKIRVPGADRYIQLYSTPP